MNTENLHNEISFKQFLGQLKDWFKYVYSYRKIFIITIIFGAGIGLLLSYNDKPSYIASTTFVLEESGSSAGGISQYAGLASAVGLDLNSVGGGLFQGDNIFELYKSRNMIESALLTEVNVDGNIQTLLDRYVTFKGLKEAWESEGLLGTTSFHASNRLKFTRQQDSLLAVIVKDIKSTMLLVHKPDKKNSIIEVLVTSDDEVFSKNFNTILVKKVNDFYIETKTKNALESIRNIEIQADSIRAVLNSAISNSFSAEDATPNLNPTRQILRSSGRKSQVDAEMNKALMTQLVQNLGIAKLSLKKETPLIQLINEPRYPLEVQKLGKKYAIIFGVLFSSLILTTFLTIKLIFKKILTSE